MPGIGSKKEVPSDFTKEIALIIDGWRARRGLRVMDLEEPLGVSSGQVSRMLRGLKHWDVDQLDRACEFLGTSIEQVLIDAEKALPLRHSVLTEDNLNPVVQLKRKISGPSVTREDYLQHVKLERHEIAASTDNTDPERNE